MRHWEPYWVFLPRYQQYWFIRNEPPEGEYESEPDIRMDRIAYDFLKRWMVENDPHGVIRTDRREDLKIIHKTLDIIQSLSEKAKKE